MKPQGKTNKKLKFPLRSLDRVIVVVEIQKVVEIVKVAEGESRRW